MLPGETVSSGEHTVCKECGKTLQLGVYHSNAGYYIGYWCDQDGPHSRESGYYKSYVLALGMLVSGTWSLR